MTDTAFDESLVLRRHVAKAVNQRGLFAVLRVVLSAWLHRARLPQDMPDRLRADMGLPPGPRSLFSLQPTGDGSVPLPMWRPGP